jgi:ubiquinone/menaquinone biosynthesis C-methylase UbiE
MIPKPICSICQSHNHDFYIETTAMMHVEKREIFRFNLCHNCESIFLTNPVPESQLSQYYTDAYLPYRGEKAWGKYANFVVWDDQKLNERRVKMAMQYLQPTPEIHVLDIGCGKPDFLAQLAEKPNIQTMGVDFTSAQWDDPKYKNLTLVEGDWRNIELNTQFDLITAWHYFEHDYDIHQTIAKCRQLLKPNGILLIEVPMYQGIIQKIQRQYWQGWHSPRHISLFSFKSWKMIFTDNDWEIVKHNKFGTMSAFTLWWLGHQEKKNIDWSGSMQGHFWNLVFWKVLLMPFFALERVIPLGVQTIVIRKK